ncbi:hypothetical protein [Aquimarina litoralis]|uniref:hypothetical protein n=1 Tax=Aquimarina litoralis TaxID=584605 RepID=UPI001C588B90|nr:hypothetical protein [Aquimarina litoralis]MBW1296090.1 hypothetical protein [Aquimarina litoralis]
MHTKEQLKEFKEIVTQTRKLGRDQIIRTALKDASKDPASLLDNEKVSISVWYNDMDVKVEVQQYYPIRYLEMNSKYYMNKTIYVSLDKVSGSNGRIIYNEKNKQISDAFGKTFLYQNTEDKVKIIANVLELNNSNDAKYYIDPLTQRRITIRERYDFYEIQIGDSYAVTYKLDKLSGKIYDYKDPYKNLLPNPATGPFGPSPIGGPWIEIKE